MKKTGDRVADSYHSFPSPVFCIKKSGWWESNPRIQLGRLVFYHWTTPACDRQYEVWVPSFGIEPKTQGFSVLCSTNWANWANPVNRRYFTWLQITCQVIFSLWQKKYFLYDRKNLKDSAAGWQLFLTQPAAGGRGFFYFIGKTLLY